MISLLALWERDYRQWGFADFLILVILVAAGIAITVAVLRFMEIEIPPLFVRIFWILLACVAGILAIRFIAAL